MAAALTQSLRYRPDRVARICRCRFPHEETREQMWPFGLPTARLRLRLRLREFQRQISQ